MANRVFQTLQIVVFTLIGIIAIMYLAGSSCLAGYCSTHNCKSLFSNRPGRREGFGGGKFEVNYQDGFHVIGNVRNGPKFQINRGLQGGGEYILTPGKSPYTGMYGDPRWEDPNDALPQYGTGDVPTSKPIPYDATKTPECMWAFSGRYDVPKCDCGYDPYRCCDGPLDKHGAHFKWVASPSC